MTSHRSLRHIKDRPKHQIMTEEENKQRMHDLLVEIETLEKDNFPIKQQCTKAIACLERALKCLSKELQTKDIAYRIIA